MALTVGDRPIRPITADEAMAMVRAGIIGEHDRVELLQGVLTEMSPQDPPHAIVVQRLNAWLAPLMAAGSHDVRVGLPFVVPDPTSLPEPDIALVEHAPGSIAHPSTALLVIEAANSSRRVDTTIKPLLYAAASVPEYWVADVRGQRVERFAGPGASGYLHRTSHAPGEVLEPGVAGVEPLDLAGLFHGL